MKFVLALVAILAAVALCQASEQAVCAWGYTGVTGPANWGTICAGAYPDCKLSAQSPIDVVASSYSQSPTAFTSAVLTTSYDSVSRSYKYFNNGHTVQVNLDKTAGNTSVSSLISGSVLGSNTYQLAQFHFHETSEHTLNGAATTAEMHLVHTRATGSGNLYAVIGIFFTESTTSDLPSALFPTPGFPAGMSNITLAASTMATVANMALSKGGLATYQGSFTTPPCTEGVTWLLAPTPLRITKAQKDAMYVSFNNHNNNRPTMAINSRVVTYYALPSSSTSAASVASVSAVLIVLALAFAF